jgi:hypothetical protein
MIAHRSRTIIAVGPARARPAPRARARGPWLQQTCLLATALLCCVLMVATLGELWVRVELDQQAAALRAHDFMWRADITSTRRAIAVATSDAAIAREARAWGWVQSGGQ